jgi:hypothetical protein
LRCFPPVPWSVRSLSKAQSLSKVQSMSMAQTLTLTPRQLK